MSRFARGGANARVWANGRFSFADDVSAAHATALPSDWMAKAVGATDGSLSSWLAAVEDDVGPRGLSRGRSRRRPGRSHCCWMWRVAQIEPRGVV
jgi:hypothetical protein